MTIRGKTAKAKDATRRLLGPSSPLPEIRHVRSGPGMPVAACGARADDLQFGRSHRYITCAACLIKRNDPVATEAFRERIRQSTAAAKRDRASRIRSID